MNGETDLWTMAVIVGLAVVTVVARCFFFILDRPWGMPAPISGEGHRLWQAADKARGAGVSVSELVRWVETQAGTEIRSPSTSPG